MTNIKQMCAEYKVVFFIIAPWYHFYWSTKLHFEQG